jgi:hypothetical protein
VTHADLLTQLNSTANPQSGAYGLSVRAFNANGKLKVPNFESRDAYRYVPTPTSLSEVSG